MNFRKFETEKIDECIAFISRLLDESMAYRPGHEFVIKATGGGAHLYYERFRDRLKATIEREDEMECLITGKRALSYGHLAILISDQLDIILTMPHPEQA